MTTNEKEAAAVVAVPNKKAYSPSTGTVLAGVALCTILLGAAVLVNLLLLLGLYYFPRTVLLGFVIPYFTYVLVLGREELKDGSGWNWFSRDFVFFPPIRRYMNLKIRCCKEVTELDKTKDAHYILAVFPHGANSDYRIVLDGMIHEVMPNTSTGIRWLAATVLFRIPLLREFALWTNCVDARRSVADQLLQSGRSLGILPGGQAEQMRTVYGKERIYLSRRKGFLRLAIRHNVPVIPVYVFGCSDFYTTSNWALSFRLWLLKNTGMAIPIAFGWNGHLLCPRPVDTTVVLGAPLSLCVKKGNETMTEDERVDLYHAEFCTAIRDLFDEHKEQLGFGDRQLEIF